MSEHDNWPEDQGAGGSTPQWPQYGPGGAYGSAPQTGSNYGPNAPYAPGHGQQPYGPAQGQQPYGPGPAQAPYGPAQGPHGPAQGQPLYSGAPYGYGPVPPEGRYGLAPHDAASQGPRSPSRAFRSAAAVLVVAAAALAGAGVSRVIWPGSSPSSSATPPVTAPAFGGSGSSSGAAPEGTGGTSGTEGAGGPSDVSTIAARVDPAVVDVNVTFNYQYAEGAGTGIVLTSNGLVLTNNHVIDEATKISVTDVGNGKTYSAQVVGYDNTHDIALIKLEGASGLATAKVASAGASIGEAVVAIGNAGGTGGTPTSAGGSVIALDQSITANDALTERSEQLSGLIEVNANVESGDSGGPLVDAAGQVIGMDTAASSSFTFSTQGNQGFAIPISYAMNVVKEIESGKGTSTVHVGPTAFLGLLLEPADDFGSGSGYAYGYVGNPFGGTSSNGLVVSSVVSGAPAQAAGVTGGDTITSFNGAKLSSPDQLTKLLVAYHPGQKVTIGWVTPDGVSHKATVTLASGPPS